jgi:hypothetical protein
LGRNAE